MQTVQLLPHQKKIVEVTLACREEVNGPYLLEPTELECGVQADQALLHVTDDRDTGRCNKPDHTVNGPGRRKHTR